MTGNIRLLPAVMISAALLLTLKVTGLVTGIDPLIAPVEAADTSEAGGAEDAAGAEENGKDAAEPHTPPVDLSARPAPTQQIQSPDVLAALASRRKTLDARQADLDMREKLLAAAEARLDGKIAELKTLKAEIDEVFKTEESRGEAKLVSLVKVYENMKPKDAAAVFEQLDMSVLLDLLDRMNERKMAAVLAAMDPARAQAVTVALATAEEDRLRSVPRPADANGGRTPMGLPELEPILPETAG